MIEADLLEGVEVDGISPTYSVSHITDSTPVS
jgi:hypothetical protein